MKLHVWLAGLAALVWCGFAHAATVGFETVSAPVAGDRPLKISIWYPSDAPEVSEPMGLETQAVARGGPIVGRGHPLVVISHGTGGSDTSHWDTAQALARAGFVVAAVAHTGDTYDDRSRALRIIERPKHLSVAIDYMTGAWRGHEAIDAGRIGAFGFSAGGFTVLAAIGGEPDMSKVDRHCAVHPHFYECQMLRMLPRQPTAQTVPAHDPRIRAGVIAAPALGYAFTPQGLAAVKVPVQLWRAEWDTVLPQPYYAEAVRRTLPKPPESHVVPGADHFDFMPACGAAMAKAAPSICGDGVFDRVAFHAAFNAEIVRFFRKTLG
ncbi:alpha/beta hydrolase family protein [Phenylobacterium sp.]|uniref:alpha/beta hydrolase family protein n=1 Tax=Phenylobacterium sp. TaxID=1871053 RepID=UPI003566498B